MCNMAHSNLTVLLTLYLMECLVLTSFLNELNLHPVTLYYIATLNSAQL